MVSIFSDIPYIGLYVQSPFQKAVQAQKDKLRQTGDATTVQVWLLILQYKGNKT